MAETLSVRFVGVDGQSMPEETLKRVLENCEAYLLAGLEYGQYPIRH